MNKLRDEKPAKFKSDRKCGTGKLVTAIGAFLIAGSFVFIGPIRIMPFPTTYEVCIASLAIHGVGFAASLVAGTVMLMSGFGDL